MTYTEKLERLYYDQAVEDLEEFINTLSSNDERVMNKLNDKIARIKDEFDAIYDNAYEMAESLEQIDDALPK